MQAAEIAGICRWVVPFALLASNMEGMAAGERIKLFSDGQFPADLTGARRIDDDHIMTPLVLHLFQLLGFLLDRHQLLLADLD